MSAPAFLKESGISNEAGYVDVDKHTLRHNKYPNIWSLGDSSSVPNSKTAAAVFSQT
jgi:NADPH-dependent 2,4-dienoyl-CoA reductase/sulfur reductase-like enzyme